MLKEQKIAITASSGLSKDEVEKMRKDAELHADEDKAKKEEIETRNEVDNAVYRTEKLVKDNADKISADDKAKIETAVAAAKAQADKAAAGSAPQGEEPKSDDKKKDEGVIDAEVVDEKK